jgi:hypothetical protein
LVGANSKIIRFCKLSEKKWNTRLHLKTKQEVIQSKLIQITFAITPLYSTQSINKWAEQSWLWISSTRNWEQNKSLLVYGWPRTVR